MTFGFCHCASDAHNFWVVIKSASRYILAKCNMSRSFQAALRFYLWLNLDCGVYVDVTPVDRTRRFSLVSRAGRCPFVLHKFKNHEKIRILKRYHKLLYRSMKYNFQNRGPEFPHGDQDNSLNPQRKFPAHVPLDGVWSAFLLPAPAPFPRSCFLVFFGALPVDMLLDLLFLFLSRLV